MGLGVEDLALIVAIRSMKAIKITPFFISIKIYHLCSINLKLFASKTKIKQPQSPEIIIIQTNSFLLLLQTTKIIKIRLFSLKFRDFLPD